MDQYPRWLYHRQTLEGVIVESAVEEQRLLAAGMHVLRPDDAGVETTTPLGLPPRWQAALQACTVPTLREMQTAMLQALWTAPLQGATVEELVFLDEIVKLVQLGLEKRGLDVPEPLMTRQRLIARAIERALEDQLELAEQALRELEDPDTRRAKAARTVERLKEQLDGPAVARLMAPRQREE